MKQELECARLLSYGVNIANINDGINECLNCPQTDCFYPPKLVKQPKPQRDTITEVFLQCSFCKATETVMMVNGELVLPVRFIQIGNSIYHTCGKVDLFGLPLA